MPAGSPAEPLVAGRSTGDPRRLQQGPSKAVFRRELGKAEKGLEEEPGLCHPNSSGGSRLSALVCCGCTVLISRALAALSGVAQKCCLGVSWDCPLPARPAQVGGLSLLPPRTPLQSLSLLGPESTQPAISTALPTVTGFLEGLSRLWLSPRFPWNLRHLSASDPLGLTPSPASQPRRPKDQVLPLRVTWG